jgi:hypothetical protein
MEFTKRVHSAHDLAVSTMDSSGIKVGVQQDKARRFTTPFDKVEVEVKDFIAGLGSFAMALAPGPTALRRSQRIRIAQILAHQGESATGDQREADQVNSSQKVVQGGEILFLSLV